MWKDPIRDRGFKSIYKRVSIGSDKNSKKTRIKGEW